MAIPVVTVKTNMPSCANTVEISVIPAMDTAIKLATPTGVVLYNKNKMLSCVVFE